VEALEEIPKGGRVIVISRSEPVQRLDALVGAKTGEGARGNQTYSWRALAVTPEAGSWFR